MRVRLRVRYEEGIWVNSEVIEAMVEVSNGGVDVSKLLSHILF
ncbi:hypothetical protein A2U01_0047548, partial [Trifolium medium]|nr:hypothetical protein [Trifolium medium]